MNNRIVQLRKNRGWTQDEFAEKMGISKNYVSLIENGRKTPGDRLVLDICREFGVNEDWLRNGNGEMKQSLTKNQEIGAFANEVMNLPDEAFKKRFVDALKKLDEKDWENLEGIANKLLKED